MATNDDIVIDALCNQITQLRKRVDELMARNEKQHQIIRGVEIMASNNRGTHPQFIKLHEYLKESAPF